MTDRTMKRLSEASEALDERGMVRAADVVDAVAKRVVLAQDYDSQKNNLLQQKQSLQRQLDALAQRRSALLGQKAGVVPSSTSPVNQEKQQQVADIDKQVDQTHQLGAAPMTQMAELDRQIAALSTKQQQQAAPPNPLAAPLAAPYQAQRPMGR